MFSELLTIENDAEAKKRFNFQPETQYIAAIKVYKYQTTSKDCTLHGYQKKTTTTAEQRQLCFYFMLTTSPSIVSKSLNVGFQGRTNC